MSYEIPLPKPELLKEKPLEAPKVMEYLNSNGFNPIAVIVDNNLGKVFVYFEEPLSSSESKRLLEVVNEFYRKHVEGG